MHRTQKTFGSIAAIVFLALAGCAQQADSEPAVEIVMLTNERDDTVTVQVTVLGGTIQTTATYNVPADRWNGPVTPPAAKDPACEPTTRSLRVEVFEGATGQQLTSQAFPISCDDTWWIIVVDEDGSALMADADEFSDGQLRDNWKRGEPWPWT